MKLLKRVKKEEEGEDEEPEAKVIKPEDEKEVEKPKSAIRKEEEAEDEAEDEEEEEYEDEDEEEMKSKLRDEVLAKMIDLEEAITKLAKSQVSIADVNAGLAESVKSLYEEVSELKKAIGGIKNPASANADTDTHLAKITGEPKPSNATGEVASLRGQETVSETDIPFDSMRKSVRREVLKQVVTPMPPTGAVNKSPGSNENPAHGLIQSILEGKAGAADVLKALKEGVIKA